MRDSLGMKSHQPSKCGIGSDRVVRKHDLFERTRSAVEGSVSFHCDYSVRDDEVNRDCGADIEDAFVNTFPVKNILRPPVSCARYYTKHVLHTESDTRP